MRGRLVAVAIVVGLFGGCRVDGGGGAPSVPFEGYCDRYAEVTCDAAERCDCLGGYSVELCQGFMGTECRDEVESSVEAGRSAFHADAAGRCLASLQRIISDCRIDDGDDLDGWDAACSAILTGLGDEGDPCDGDDECRDGLECFDDSCVRMPGEGAACLEGYACAEGFYCGSDDACHGERGRGEACPDGDYSCGDDLYCDGRSTTCQPYIASGEPCEHASYACDDDLYCSPESGTCRPYPGAGQGCVDSDGSCADDLYCDAAGQCQRQLGAGAACDEDEQCLSYDCVDGLCEADEDDGICPF